MASNARIAIWDGWRGLAILLVLIGHFSFSNWVWEERMGVDVFFVLSGMLMSNILFVDRIALRDFYIRRISRVMPALLVFLCAAFAVGLIMKYEFKVIELFASLFFVRTYFPIDPGYYTDATLPTGHLWSLSVEEHSYVVMSLLSLVLIARFKISIVLFAIFLLSVAINFYHYFTLPLEELKGTFIRTESAIGLIAFSAAYNLMVKEKSIKIHPYMPLLLTIAAFLCYIKAVPIWTTFLLCPVMLGVAVNHLTDSAKPIAAVLTLAPLRQLGILSYSVYLWQQIFYRLYYTLPGGEITGFVLSIIVGACSFYILENPARRYINNRWSPHPTYHGRS